MGSVVLNHLFAQFPGSLSAMWAGLIVIGPIYALERVFQ